MPTSNWNGVNVQSVWSGPSGPHLFFAKAAGRREEPLQEESCQKTESKIRRGERHQAGDDGPLALADLTAIPDLVAAWLEGADLLRPERLTNSLPTGNARGNRLISQLNPV